jgi:sugar (pentulose or hexulose) kinase
MLLGIDLGTTALKVAAYDRKSGVMLAGVEKRLKVEVGDDGLREQSPEAVTRALRQAIRGIGREVGGLVGVQGVALAAQGGSTIIARRETGVARTPMMLWNDGRAFPEFQEVSTRHTARYWRTRTMRDEPGMGLARIAWLRKRQPALLGEENIYVGAGEYVYHQFTGLWRQDACNAMQIGAYDTRRGRMTKELSALVDVSPDFFAPLRDGHATHPLSVDGAKYFGLPEGIPVAGPYMDHEAGFLSVAHTSKRPLQCSLGTAWVGNFCLPEEFSGTSPFQFAIPSPLGSGQLVVQPLLTGNVTWDWTLENFVDPTMKRALVKQARIFSDQLLPPDGLVALPWLNRPNTLQPDLLGGACFLGMGPATHRDDLLRAVAAGMSHELARVFADVQAAGAVDSLVLSGGASQGTHFQKLICGLFPGLSVYQVDDGPWMGTRGVLHGFGVRASQAKVRRVRADGVDGPALSQSHAYYLDVFARLYGHVTAGQAYRIERRSTS